MILQRENDLKFLVVHLGGNFLLKGLLIFSNWSFVVFDVSLSIFSVCFCFLSSPDNSETPAGKCSSWPLFPPKFQVFLFNRKSGQFKLYQDHSKRWLQGNKISFFKLWEEFTVYLQAKHNKIATITSILSCWDEKVSIITKSKSLQRLRNDEENVFEKFQRLSSNEEVFP